MAAVTSTAVLVRLAQVYAKAHPTENDEQIVRRAKNLIDSLRSVGLDVVYQDWVDDPMSARVNPDRTWDPFIEGMKVVYEQNKERAPWRP